MRIEPEQVLKQERVSAQGRIENAQVESTLSATSTMAIATTGVPSTWMMLVA